MEVDQVYDGGPFEIDGAEVILVCCDCDLTHRVRITKRRGKKHGYRITVWRLDRSTGQRRRHRKKGNENV